MLKVRLGSKSVKETILTGQIIDFLKKMPNAKIKQENIENRSDDMEQNHMVQLEIFDEDIKNMESVLLAIKTLLFIANDIKKKNQ